MNQILVVGNKNRKSNNSNIDIKKIIMFFSVAIIVFGIVLIIMGAVGVSKNKGGNDKNKGAVVDTIPTPTETPTIDDEEAPIIDLAVVGENVKVIARDETEIDYIEYKWNDEEVKIVNANQQDKNKIETLIEIKQGTNTLKVVAFDKADNTYEVTQEFQGKIRPTIKLLKNEEGNGVIIEAYCDDGINKLEFTLNGNWTRIPFAEHSYTKEAWATMGVTIENSADGKVTYAKYEVKLNEGENIINAYAYSLEGLVGTADGKATYNTAE